MAIEPQEFARMLGAEIVGEVPDVGGGPFGMARLAHLMHQRLTPSRGERPGRPTDPSWVIRTKVPMSAATARKLANIAQAMSTPDRRVSPMQVAAQLLEEAVGCLPSDTASATEATVPSTGGIKLGGDGNDLGLGGTTKPRHAEHKAEGQAAPQAPERAPDVRTRPPDKVVTIKSKGKHKPRRPSPKTAARRRRA